MARRVGVGVVLAVAGFLALRFMLANDGYPALLTLRDELRTLQAEVNELGRVNGSLGEAIESLHGESYTVEKIARENLDLVAPGEILYLFPLALATEVDTEPGAAVELP